MSTTVIPEQPRSVNGPPVVFEGLGVRFGPVEALRSVDLVVPSGELVAVIGPSGCGKSTMLRVVADLCAPSAGKVTVGGQSPAQVRGGTDYGFLFQTPIMLPWLRLKDNVALAGKLVGESRALREEQAARWIDRVGLSGFEEHRPHQLSGGMRQRAALARAMTLSPSLLLMDEPFGALDEITRHRMIFEVLSFISGYSATVLLVTHSLDEAVLMADRIAVMSNRPGQIKAIVENPLPVPRTRDTQDDPMFHEVRREVRRLIEEGDA
jgi:NitT/TauT family transport system ATP-binding protein